MSKHIYLPVMLDLGTTLYNKRCKKGITIQEVTAKTDLTESDILAIENIEGLYPIHHLILYANFLNFKLQLIPD